MSSGASRWSCRILSSVTGVYELPTTRRAPNFSAISSANSTALSAVSDPSVPTATTLIILFLSSRASSIEPGRLFTLAGAGYDLRAGEPGGVLRFPIWMQGLMVAALAVVLALAVTDVVDDFTDWIVLGGIL